MTTRWLAAEAKCCDFARYNPRAVIRLTWRARVAAAWLVAAPGSEGNPPLGYGESIEAQNLLFSASRRWWRGAFVLGANFDCFVC